ncbi:sigma-70 family RNA polymerase sigma factor, partial [Leucobacter sp. M11]|uniref:sigma-70 family RNA polymerase sigma factor n=1 Tax=Leucobacter sp. M11 TaxID=2993565 RepID=UPI002D7E79D9
SLGRPSDVDDLVAEAYLRILTALQQGSGPTSLFRPYLYRTIASLVATWGGRQREFASDALDDISDPEAPETAVEDRPVAAFELGAAVTAFQSLPEQWRTVLWYTEIEGLTPAKAAPHLGLTARAVAVKSSRARDHLRSAWVRAHLSTAGKPAACADAIEHFDGLRRGKLRASTEHRVRAHLSECAPCTSAYEEFGHLSSRLRAAVFPVLFGGGIAAALLRDGVSAPAASAAVLPAAPAGSGAAPGAGSGTAGGGTGAASAGFSAAGITGLAATGVAVLAVAGLAFGAVFPLESTEGAPAGPPSAGPAPGPAESVDSPRAETSPGARPAPSSPGADEVAAAHAYPVDPVPLLPGALTPVAPGTAAPYPGPTGHPG